ncbi:MAG: polyketide synthase, partial [Nodularia sp. (in: cyanobacteria)]|nr:polyketide synthase [Nodularia sp. (in: cyanobacteria)]
VGGNCSRWISKTLQDKEHFTVSLNRRGIDDHISIIRVLAKLLSHQVEMDLSPLYALSPENSSPNHVVSHKTDEILISENTEKIPTLSDNPSVQQYELLQMSEFVKSANTLSQKSRITELKTVMINSNTEEFPENIELDNKNKTSSVLLCDRPILPEKEPQKNLLTNNGIANKKFPKNPQPNLRNPHYQKLINNISQSIQTHSVLLELRQQSLHQISALIQQQLELYQKLFNQSNPKNE